MDELIRVIRRELKEPLRACHPRDLVNQICWKARYKQVEPCLDRDALLAAVDSYFVRDTDEPEAEVSWLLRSEIAERHLRNRTIKKRSRI